MGRGLAGVTTRGLWPTLVPLLGKGWFIAWAAAAAQGLLLDMLGGVGGGSGDQLCGGVPAMSEFFGERNWIASVWSPWGGGPMSLARPKSMTRTMKLPPSGDSMMLSSLRSRWTTYFSLCR